jgi:NAD(P)H-hydrate epimerase
MASGGMGDVLTGMVAGFMAQGWEPLFCAQFAAFVHGRIGDMLASRQGDRGIIATDIVNEIPAALQHFA